MRWLVLLLGACRFHGEVGTSDGTTVQPDMQTGRDTGIDTSVVADAPAFCLGDTTIQVCLDQKPAAPLPITSASVNTDDPTMCAANVVGGNKGELCVLAGNGITLSGTLSAHGSRPLVLFSSDMMMVTGTIDVAGHFTGTPQSAGAGGDSVLCVGATLPTGGAGGFGGTLGQPGATGGGDGAGGIGGLPPTPVPDPPALRGGCAGSDGSGGGAGGHSGGGVALLAATSIQIDGTINASGAGGAGSHAGGKGGGGGGSGGMIVIDAPVVTGGGGAKIFANGGGGGEGKAGNDGHDGADAPGDPNMAAAGGAGGSTGGDGGKGAIHVGTAAEAPGAGMGGASAGGGGGGGGTGVIKKFKAASLPGNVSPPAT